MATAAPTYDLVLLLDPQAEDDARAKIVAGARAAIESQGELLRHDEWGTRTLAYPIKRKTVAEYHMMQFHASSADLLRQLDRSLRLADEALRHRIVKLAAGVPEPPDMRSDALAPGASRPGHAPAAPTPPAQEAAADETAADEAAADEAAAPPEPAPEAPAAAEATEAEAPPAAAETPEATSE
jgi:small subunit ribosomal protein S6